MDVEDDEPKPNRTGSTPHYTGTSTELGHLGTDKVRDGG